MKQRLKSFFGIAVIAVLLVGIFPLAGARVNAAVSCKSLCGAALKASGGSENLEYQSDNAMDFGALSASARKKVKAMQYVCDSKEVYSLCVMQAKNAAGAKALQKQLQKYKKSNSGSDYLQDYSSEEQEVFKNAICGRKGKYVWYIALSPQEEVNIKGEKAIKKKL